MQNIQILPGKDILLLGAKEIQLLPQQNLNHIAPSVR